MEMITKQNGGLNRQQQAIFLMMAAKMARAQPKERESANGR